MTQITVAPITTALGAEIFGVDLREALSVAVIAEIRQALLDHCVIFFRDQDLDVEAHKRFARRFGEIFVHPNFNTGDHDPQVVTIARHPGDRLVIGEHWHTDTTMMKEPPMGAQLYAIETPPYGGDTMFANQQLAYETLSDGMRAMIANLRCLHSDRIVAGPNSRATQLKKSTPVRDDTTWQQTTAHHPVVRTHPETGRKSLFVNQLYTIAFENMTDEESKPLLNWLIEWGCRPEFTCRFRWQPGSLAFWDNRCVQHIALHDVHNHSRIMRRIQIKGDRPF